MYYISIELESDVTDEEAKEFIAMLKKVPEVALVTFEKDEEDEDYE